MVLRSLLKAFLAVLLVAFAAVSLQSTTAVAAPAKAAAEAKSGAAGAKRKLTAQSKSRTKIAKAAKSRAKFAKKRGKSVQAAKARKRGSIRVAGRGGSGGINWNAGGSCLPASVKSALYSVAANYGSITVNSTYRSRGHNRSVGGAGRSMHLQCRAADFRVNSGGSGVLNYLQGLPGLGGIKRYRSGYFHIDNGPRRTWAG